MVCYSTVNTNTCVRHPPTPHSFLILWVLVTWTITHSLTVIETLVHKHKHTHADDGKGRRGEKKKNGNNVEQEKSWPVSTVPFESDLLRFDIPAGKALKRTSTIRKRPPCPPLKESSAVSAWFCAPAKSKRERNLHSDLPLLALEQSHWNVPGFTLSFPLLSSLYSATGSRF